VVPGFSPETDRIFYTRYMNEEFNRAYNKASSGYEWHKFPPGFEPAPTQEPTRPDMGAGK